VKEKEASATLRMPFIHNNALPWRLSSDEPVDCTRFGVWLMMRCYAIKLVSRSDGSVAHGGTDGSQTRRWRKPDSNRWSHFGVSTTAAPAPNQGRVGEESSKPSPAEDGEDEIARVPVMVMSINLGVWSSWPPGVDDLALYELTLSDRHS
jgi:hypothetical protein